MIKGKKFTVIALSLMLTTSFASGALANNGKGGGLADAPGQSENFSKGVTTVVDVTENVSHATREETSSAITSVTTTPVTESVAGEPVVTVRYYEEKHPAQDWTRIVKETTTSITTTVRTWDETTAVTTHSLYEVPVTITETTTTTSTHRGAPGSNGKQLSEIAVTDTQSVDGEWVLLSTKDDSVVTNGEVAETINTASEIALDPGKWSK